MVWHGVLMRHEQYRGTFDDAATLFDEVPVIHVAGTGEDGRLILRTVHGVVVDGWLAFHGSPKGEKVMMIGQPVVASAEDVVASIPSYFLDAERACPATTYYRSAQVSGTLERLDDGALKAKALQALMEKLQPEGGHAPITADHPLYAAAVRGILVVGVRLDSAVAKFKLGQNRKPDELRGVLEALWQRGAPADARAIERVLNANRERLGEVPAFLAAPPGVQLSPALAPADAPRVAELLEGQYWLVGMSRDRIARAHVGSSAWVGARDVDGRVIGSARALADGARLGWIYDVVVDPAFRGRGVATAMTRLLLDHPALRGVAKVQLGTRDAMPVYAKLGFRAVDSPLSTTGTTLMALTRA